MDFKAKQTLDSPRLFRILLVGQQGKPVFVLSDLSNRENVFLMFSNLSQPIRLEVLSCTPLVIVKCQISKHSSFSCLMSVNTDITRCSISTNSRCRRARRIRCQRVDDIGQFGCIDGLHTFISRTSSTLYIISDHCHVIIQVKVFSPWTFILFSWKWFWYVDILQF